MKTAFITGDMVRFSKEEEKAREQILEEETSIFSVFHIDEPAPPHFFSTLMYHIKEWYHSIRFAMQRIFRRNHLADIDLWNFDFAMARWIYPRLKVFIGEERFGYPNAFSEYEENVWPSEEAYNKAVKKREHLGGGLEAWKKVLQEMLFAFEWKLHYEHKEQHDTFCKKWNIKNPHEKNIENKSVSYEYTCKDRLLSSVWSDEMDLDKKEPEKYVFLRRRVSYYNAALNLQIAERAQKGFELFGKYFLDLWD